MDQLSFLTIIFCNQQHDVEFVFKFRTISKQCKDIANYWLTELIDTKGMHNVDIKQFKNLRKFSCTDETTDEDLQKLKYITHLQLAKQISDEGIKHLKLKEISAIGKYSLLASSMGVFQIFNKSDLIWRYQVTDNLIHYTDLYYLYANGYTKITRNGINPQITSVPIIKENNITSVPKKDYDKLAKLFKNI